MQQDPGLPLAIYFSNTLHLQPCFKEQTDRAKFWVVTELLVEIQMLREVRNGSVFRSKRCKQTPLVTVIHKSGNVIPMSVEGLMANNII